MTRWTATATAMVITVGVGSAGQAAAQNGRQRNRIGGQSSLTHRRSCRQRAIRPATV